MGRGELKELCDVKPISGLSLSRFRLKLARVLEIYILLDQIINLYNSLLKWMILFI